MLFDERYAKLNAGQKMAVDEIDGPVLVVAGPGTGKTEILTLRIGNILQKTDARPENILALTFTDAAASNMRKRLATLIGSPAYRVAIETFHSFCNNVIQNYPEYFEKIVGAGNITEVEAMGILEELVQKLPLDLLRPWGDALYYLRDIYKKIEELKREGLTPDEFSELIKKEKDKFEKRDDLYHEKGAHKGKMKGEHKLLEKQLVKNLELSKVYDAYQKELHGRRLYDWSDMIMEVLSALQTKPDLKLLLQENYQYILVDEHQDTNNAQNKILELLSDFHPNPNIFVVGDEKQAIFRFQGASIENFLHFQKLYPKAKVIELSQNYRSHQEILDAAHSLIPSKTALVSAGQKNKTSETAKILVAEFSKKDYEIQFVAERIKNLIEKNAVKAEEIAVLYRSNKEAFAVRDALSKIGVPSIVESDEDLLSEKFVQKFLTVLEAIWKYGDDEKIIPALHLDEFGIDPLDVYKLISTKIKNANGEREKSVYDLLDKSDKKEITEFGNKMKTWVRLAQSEHLSQFLEKVLRESGILNSMIAEKDAGSFLGIEKLFEEGKRISGNRPGVKLADFMEFISVIRERKLFIKRPKNGSHKAVRLMTAHRAKGLEFEFVHIINASENSFGPKQNRDSLKLLPSVYVKSEKESAGKNSPENESESEAEADERRLFYVALTRAKQNVFVSFASVDENDKSVLVSPFVGDIRADRKENVETKKFEENLKANPEQLFAEKKINGVPEADKEFLTELFYSHPLSVTALNNYLDCPWKYFYRNLLRIPSAMQKHQIYGTAMHAAVEDMWRAMSSRREDSEIGLEFLQNSFKRQLGLLGILTESEFAEALARGNDALAGWWKWSKPQLKNLVVPEFKISGVILPGTEIVLSGVLDKIEMVSNKNFIVTDYKTGKPKSRNDILGGTKSSKGDIKRQLQFYKLLLQLHDGTQMQKAVVEFLEPRESGEYSREEFEIADAEVAELTETIKRVADEITSLAFWHQTCDDSACEYCAYRKLLK
jgi:DNA helicase-2/ATP-dependent DNA helicase PcrA